ncbi:MAG: hypothetical protein VYA67_21850 [Actinomycetota bacterium]|nr:hypothetical protein [Actinomycetota bacterium]
MIVCVCGCPPELHRTMTMSVPLPKLTAGPDSPWPTVATTYPNSTYDRDDCQGCGCGQYLMDTGDVAAVG